MLVVSQGRGEVHLYWVCRIISVGGVSQGRGGVHLYWVCRTISVGGVSREGWGALELGL